MALESSGGELQLWFGLHSNRRLELGDMSSQSIRTLTHDSFGTLKCHSDVASMESCGEYYMGEGGGFPSVRAMVSQMSPSARGLS
jgi:hypothetical protein